VCRRRWRGSWFEDHPDHGPLRMIYYTADHHGELTPSREIAEKA
jgi:hypothetical protein